MDYNQKTDLLQDETLSQKLIKKGFWLYLFSYLVAPAGYLVRLLISNSPEVSVEDVGVLYSIISLVTFLNVYNDLGLTESLQYFLPKFWIEKKYNWIKTIVWLSFLVQTATAVLIACGLRFGGERLANHYFHNPNAEIILKYFCLYFLGINIFQTLQSIFIAFQKTFDYQFVDFIRMRSIVWFTVFCFFTQRGTIERYSLNWIFGLTIGIIIAGFLYLKKYRSSLMQGTFERNEPMLKKYRNYALWAFLGANIGNIFGQIIQQMVIYFLGAEAAGYYTNFLSLFYIGNMVIGPIIGLIFPMVSELIEKKDNKKLWLLFSFFYSYFSVFIWSISVLFITLGPDIAIALFGEKYELSGQLLSLTWIFLIFNILTGFNFSVLAGLGKIKERVKILGISTIITILFTYCTIKLFGLRGTGMGFGLSYFILWCSSFPYLLKASKFTLQWKFIIKNLIILSILGGVLFLWRDEIWLIHETRSIIIIKLIWIWLLYGWIIAWFNRRQIAFLKNEVKNITWKRGRKN